MAEKQPGWKFVVYYGTAGTQAATLIPANITDVDAGGGDFEYIDQPTRGDGVTIPQTDETPVQRKIAPKFTMIYHDTDSHVAALLEASKAVAGTLPVGKAFLIKRKIGGRVEFDGDAWVSYSAPGQIKEGQPIEFTLHPTSAYGRAWL